MEKQRKTFLSYSRINKDFAIRLAKELKAEGFDVWLDQLDIPAGSRWDREVERALEESEIFMIILTPASIDSENVLDEIGYAIDNGKRILPVLLENCKVPLRLRRFQYVDFTNKSFDDGVESAKELLRGLIAQPTIPRAQVPRVPVQPEIDREPTEDRDAKVEADPLALQKAEEERIAKEKIELDRRVKEEAERLFAQKAEAERLAKAKADAERKAKADARRKAKEETDRLAAQKAEEERLAAAKTEADRQAKEDADRLAAQKAEDERLAKQKAEQEQLAKAKADAERKAREDTDRLAAQQAEAERLAQQRAEEERLAKAKEEAERLAAQKAEQERLAGIEADRIAAQKVEAERLARFEADRKAKSEAERLAQQKVKEKAAAAEIKAVPVAAPVQKKRTANVMMYAVVAVVVLAVVGIGFSVLNTGNKNSPAATLTAQAAIVVPATESPATPTTAPTNAATLVPTPIGGGTGKIAFICDDDRGPSYICIMNADGSDQTRLADGYYPYPVWSPDGKKIAFRDDDTINLMNADGSDKTSLADGYFDPVWSPDGKQLAYVSEGNIFVINADGSNLNQLTKLGAHIYGLSWSPDGKNIVLTMLEGAGGATNIYSMNADGSNLRRIAGAYNIYIQRLVWSPDGKYVTFESDRDGYQNIYIMNTDGSGQNQLTENSGANKSPDWSPDGKKIVFVSNRDQPNNPPANCVVFSRPCVGEIYIMNADGSNQTRLTNNSADDYQPVWSPDGKYIAFSSERDGNYEIYIMNADGSEQTRLTNNAAADQSPAWQP